jgi:hypothetical protein
MDLMMDVNNPVNTRVQKNENKTVKDRPNERQPAGFPSEVGIWPRKLRCK